MDQFLSSLRHGRALDPAIQSLQLTNVHRLDGRLEGGHDEKSTTQLNPIAFKP
jgi:hypothetical protein